LWCAEHGHAPTGVCWEIYDHWRDAPDEFETLIGWRLA
jgi:hypothetical protein